MDEQIKEEQKLQQPEDKQLKKMGMSVLCGLMFGLVAGLVIVVILVVFRQEAAPEILDPVEKTEAVEKQADPEEKKNGVDDTEKDGEEATNQMDDINEMNSDSEIDMTVAKETQATVVTDVTEVVDRVMPCVVSIFGKYTIEDDFWGYLYDYETEGGGSGIIVGENDTELLIATNNHVVEDSDELTVQFIDASVAEASVKGTDADMDLAVIAINLSDLDPATKKQIRIATLGNSDYLKVGEPAIAIGNALGTGQSVTTGVISAVNRAYNPKIADYATEGMGYAIPISTAEPILKDLMEKKTKPSQKNDSATYLGISGMAVTGELLEKYDIKEGIYITQVFDHTPAKEAGIHKGDILLEIDGYTVGKMSDLTEVLSYYKVGDKVAAKLMTRTNDGYQPYETTVTLGGK